MGEEVALHYRTHSPATHWACNGCVGGLDPVQFNSKLVTHGNHVAAACCLMQRAHAT